MIVPDVQTGAVVRRLWISFQYVLIIPTFILLVLCAWPWWLITGHNYMAQKKAPFKWVEDFLNRHDCRGGD